MSVYGYVHNYDVQPVLGSSASGRHSAESGILLSFGMISNTRIEKLNRELRQWENTVRSHQSLGYLWLLKRHRQRGN